MRRALLLCMLFACRPDFGDRDSLVTGTVVLAVRGEPPEAKPNEPVTYTMLVATPDGPAAATAQWAHCATPKLLTENGAVSAACLGAGVRPLGDAPTIIASVPEDACFLFGPEVAAADLRPRDPDVTGGFYQPVRVLVPGAESPAFGLERIACKLGGASAEVAADHARRYRTNLNPTLLPVVANVPLDAISRGSRVTFRAGWAAGDAEGYIALDVAEQRIVDCRESMRVSWFATAGAFANDRTGRAEDDPETYTDNDWTAPDESRAVHLHVVLRDSRGGVAFATHALVVR